MNLSELIRSCLSSPKTAVDVYSEIGGNLALIRGCIQTMVKVGLLERIGDAKPYRYRVARPLKQKLRGVEKTMAISQAQQVRDWLKANGPAKNAEVSKGTGFPPKKCCKILSSIKRYGLITQDSERVYHFVSDPIKVKGMDEFERREANARNNRNMRSRRRDAIHQRISDKRIRDEISEIKGKDLTPKQSVEDWIKAGGKIDRSPTEHKFERLTKEDIESGAVRGFGGYQMPYRRRFSTIG